MSIQSVLGQAVPITIDGRRGKLHPLGLYEVGVCESSYIAYCRRQTLKSTMGLPEIERIKSIDLEIAHVATLDTDATPIFEWIIGSHEGLCEALSSCIELDDRSAVSPRECGRWYMESGRDGEGSPTFKWMVASKLRPDPTEAAPAAETTKSDEAADKS